MSNIKNLAFKTLNQEHHIWICKFSERKQRSGQFKWVSVLRGEEYILCVYADCASHARQTTQSYLNSRWRWCTALSSCCWFSQRWWPLARPRKAADLAMYTALCSNDAFKIQVSFHVTNSHGETKYISPRPCYVNFATKTMIFSGCKKY